MTEIQIALLGIAIGGVVSWLISWVFFRKAVNKRLSAYVQFSSAVLSGVDDPAVREALEIRYRNTKIDDLLQLQFVVANEGERAIRDVIEPLSLLLPSEVRLLDGKILHTEPHGRKVEIKWTDAPQRGTVVAFPFNVLNKGEFFYRQATLERKA